MTKKQQKLRVLFLCTGNSCRSQMAEGWAQHFFADTFDVFSAGIEKHGIDPFAVQVMSEAGIDISSHESKLIDELDSKDFDYVITLCDHAKESCPLFPGEATMIHHGFDDPKTMTETTSPFEERIEPYRRVRDEIRSFVRALPELLNRV
ncbi:MAG: arsenate reductase ArsC [Syntrophaceae bacterium]|nr:arsenate reductase ArsC [Syntrophaceae bacterium]